MVASSWMALAISRPRIFVNGHGKPTPRPFDVVLSRRCNPGDTGFVSPGYVEFALGQNLVLLRSDGQRVLQPFLRWLVRGPEWWHQVDKYINVGAVFDSLKCADIPGFRLPIPTASQPARHRRNPRRPRRQDRAEPSDERDVGGYGAGAVSVLVRRLRPCTCQDGRPRHGAAERHRRPVPRSGWRGRSWEKRPRGGLSGL